MTKKGAAKNKKVASRDVRKDASLEKGSPAKDKELDGFSEALSAQESPAKDTKDVSVKEEELDGFGEEALSAKGSPVKDKKDVPAKEEDLDGLCEALDKVDVKGDNEEKVGKDQYGSLPKTSFRVVDDIEKEEFVREEKGRKGGRDVPPDRLPPQVRMPTKKDYKIPREWGNYTKCGEVVPTTPFLPFKSPLSEDRFARHPELEEHTIVSLIQDLSSRGIRLTTVIDLTLPFFYETEFLEAFDIRYEKIRIDNQEPRWHQVKRFLEICDDFAEQQFKRKREYEARQAERKAAGEPEEYYMYEVIGVHCTRGVNRTGYMICRAMIERMNYTAEHAVRLFNEARGHDMTEFFPELKRAEEKKKAFERRNQYGGGRGRGGGEYRGGRGGGEGGYRGGRGGGGERGRGAPRGRGGAPQE